jgi:hypothetical protein
MLNLVIGIVIGAVFSPFWMKVWTWVKALFAKETTDATVTPTPVPPAVVAKPIVPTDTK